MRRMREAVEDVEGLLCGSGAVKEKQRKGEETGARRSGEDRTIYRSIEGRHRLSFSPFLLLLRARFRLVFGRW